MDYSKPDIKLFVAILDGSYSPEELRDFIKICYYHALPIIRKKILTGKLNLNTLGLDENSVVQDCLADIFHRDEKGHFKLIQGFFHQHLPDVNNPCIDDCIITLRHLIYSIVAKSIIRIHSQADPVFGKILRNINIAISKSQILSEVIRFNETYLVPNDIDLLVHNPPMPYDELKQMFSQTANINDDVPDMLIKLHDIITRQDRFQRSVPLISATLLLKEAYLAGWKTETNENNLSEVRLNAEDMEKLIVAVCDRTKTEMYANYVTTGKLPKEKFDCYFKCLKDYLTNEYINSDGNNKNSLYDHLKNHIPMIDRNTYRAEHRATLEYMLKKAKDNLIIEFGRI